ncbi:hypothetical protein XAC3810_660012 [Xanthomonas citri pv. citri]|nr:hypothetical protein XAC3824_820039 [Xanthomonas citri pv. citri]CEE36619.1 hypothetical protein XAC1083_650012 [Xanthomonas citri pv. citri]CEE45593.1 hypothetical protein XAC3810_660012 [Xanthomonas citri pv. citri]CEE46588.1 hypothetical protein XAC902_970012 [Xanthomonas citri pv. citri]CEE54199.1 hypothetical protein XAC3608_1290001 [Xanthomonas citri pv. citri]
MLGAAHPAQAAYRNVVLERQRSQHLDAQVVCDEIFGCKRGFDVFTHVHVERAADQAAVVGFGSDLMGADGNGPVAFGLRQCGEADERSQDGEQEGRVHTHGKSRGVQWMWEVLALGVAAALILINSAVRSDVRACNGCSHTPRRRRRCAPCGCS